MRTMFVILMLVTLAACSYGRPKRPEPDVILADTPDAQKCGRDCEQIYQTCVAGCGPPPVFTIGPGYCHHPCVVDWQHCLTTCPGSRPRM